MGPVPYLRPEAAMVVKKKTCKRCKAEKPIGKFPRSAFAKDGHLGYCEECWSTMISKSAKRHKHKVKSKPRVDPKVDPKSKLVRASTGPSKKLVDMANDALKAASSTKELFLVRTDERQPKVEMFDNEGKALRQAMEWKMKGLPVTVWRQCEFEMVLRIIG